MSMSPGGPESADHTPRTSAVAVVATLFAVILPFLGLIAAVILLWGWGFHWTELGILCVMYLASAIGVTVGYHRYFTHRSFDTGPVVKSMLAILGGMSLEGSLLKWVAHHRRHHRFSDHEGDPHSPLHHGGGVLGTFRGFWHAHMGWFFGPDPKNLDHYVRDLSSDRLIRRLDALFGVWVLLGVLIPAVAGWLLIGGWKGAVLGALWGGFVRVFLVHHVTWSVNSVCHLWGTRPYPEKDHSRNNFVFGILGLGEGWHNNHHAFPTSARHGFKWWQIDASYMFIRALAWLGLAHNIKLPKALKGSARSTLVRPDVLSLPQVGHHAGR